MDIILYLVINCTNISNDDWFMIRHEELKALHEDLSQTLESFKAVTKSKDSLRGKSADVKGILSTILAGLKIHFC